LGEEDGVYVSLGDGGEIVLQFTDVALTGDGTGSWDLAILDVGSADGMYASISENGTDWIALPFASIGGWARYNIDQVSGYSSDALYRYVKIVDDANGDTAYPSAGYDVDAVAAIHYTPVPVPAAVWLLGSGLLGLLGFRRKA
jgi:hypothetical protein